MIEDVVVHVKGEGGYTVTISAIDIGAMSRSDRRRIQKAGMLMCGKYGTWKKAKALKLNTDVHSKPICPTCIREINEERRRAKEGQQTR